MMSSDCPKALINQAEVLMQARRYEEAIATFQKALAIAPANIEVLRQYGKALAQANREKEAFEIFERALEIAPNDSDLLRNYGDTLSKKNQHKKALEILEKALTSKPNDVKVLGCYSNALKQAGKLNESCKIFDKLLETEANNVRTLNLYAQVLVLLGKGEEAFNLFERSLKLQPNNAKTLSQYADALAAMGQDEKALQFFEHSLQIQPNDAVTLSLYAKALTSTGQNEKALKFFEHSLQIQPNDAITLSLYARTLASVRQDEKALQFFEKLLQIQPDDAITLSRYADALASAGQDEEALEVFEHSLKIEPNNAITLSRYADTLASMSQREEALQFFERSLQIQPDDIITLTNYVRALEEVSKYQEAIDQLESINLDWLTLHRAIVMRVDLGRLYYRIKQLEKGDEYFEAAYAHSDDKERTLLYSARSILATNSYSETAIEMLQKIAEDSPRYAEALEMLTLNLSEEDYFEMVKTDTQSGLSNTEMLNRSMYHKIANEISILKSIAYRILRRSEREDPLLSGIIQDIEDVFSEVDRRRVAQKSEIETISHDDYASILAVISKTAHDISDFVNNQLAVIESKTRRAMQKLQPTDTHYVQFKKLLTQLELTQAALNDLKAINEGIRIKYRRFKVQKLFEKWESEPQIAQAQIVLNIQNGNSEFNGDEEKIKSALNELVENSLKHNSNQQSLTIRITSQDVMNPSAIRGRSIPGEQKYLFVEFADNGKGVPANKKDWIFQPLKTTSQEDKGSGLGLFIIRKTLTKMNGYIRETGNNGARFEIYIPYITVES